MIIISVIHLADMTSTSPLESPVVDATKNLRNCPPEYPFAVNNGARCMRLFRDVIVNDTDYNYRKCSRIFYFITFRKIKIM